MLRALDPAGQRPLDHRDEPSLPRVALDLGRCRRVRVGRRMAPARPRDLRARPGDRSPVRGAGRPGRLRGPPQVDRLDGRRPLGAGHDRRRPPHPPHRSPRGARPRVAGRRRSPHGQPRVRRRALGVRPHAARLVCHRAGRGPSLHRLAAHARPGHPRPVRDDARPAVLPPGGGRARGPVRGLRRHRGTAPHRGDPPARSSSWRFSSAGSTS